MTLSAGSLTAGGMVAPGGRGFLVITGAPVRALGTWPAGEPGESSSHRVWCSVSSRSVPFPGGVRDGRLTGLTGPPSTDLRPEVRVAPADDQVRAARQFLLSFVGQRVSEGRPAGWLSSGS